MSDQTKKPGGGAEDLLSKLFEMDDNIPSSNFSEETKVDPDIRGSVQKKPAQPAGKPEGLMSLDDLLNEQGVMSGGTPPEKKTEEFGDIFEGILEEEPAASEKISIFSAPKGGSEDDEATESSNRTEVISKKPSNPFESHQSGKTLMLEDALVEDGESTVEATQTVTLKENVPPLAHDPIDAALSDFADSSKDEGHTEEIPAKAEGPVKSKSISKAILSKGSSSKAGESKEPSVSANEFSEGFSNKPIQVSSDMSYESTQSWKKPMMKWAAVAASGVVVAGVLFTGYNRIKSDAGLFGFRIEGFSIVRAYQPPSEAQVKDFDTQFQAALAARQSDDPKKIEEVIPRLKSILLMDERNLEAASLLVEHAAILTVWYGLKSQWPLVYDESLQGLNIVLDKRKDVSAVPALERAKAWRTLALGEPQRAYTDLVSILAKLSKADDEVHGLLVELTYQAGGKAEIEKWNSQLTRKPGLRVQFVQALSKDDDSRIIELGNAGYLPARVEELLRQNFRKETAAKLLQRSEALLEEVKAYLPLSDKLRQYRGDLFAFTGEDQKAIAEWKPVVERTPKNGTVWLKLAKSYEEEAMWDEAISAYREADKARVLSEQGLLRFAKLLRVRGKVLEAVSLIDDALKTNPKSALLYYEKGMVQLAIYQSDKAKEAFVKALEIDSKLEPAVLGLARLSMQRKDWAEAEIILKRIAPQSAHHSEALLSLATIAKNRYQFDVAEKLISRAVSENPKLEAAYPDLIELYLFDEKDERAVSVIKGGLDVLPRSPLLKVAMARVYQFRGDLDQAMSELEFPRKNFSHMSEVNYALADIMIDSKQVSQAYEIINPLVQKEVKDAELQFLRAKAFYHDAEANRGVGSMEAAYRAVDAAVRLDEENIRYRILAAQISLQLQDKNSAAEHLERALKVKPHYAPALLIRGDLYRDSGDYEHASQAYLDAVQYTRFDAPIYGRLADAFKAQGNAPQAIEFYQKVIQSAPGDARANLELGKLYSDAGQYVNAFKSLNTAIRLNPSVGETYYFLGFVQKELDDRKGAIKSFEKFLSMEPSGTEAATVRDEIYFLKGSAN